MRFATRWKSNRPNYARRILLWIGLAFLGPGVFLGQTKSLQAAPVSDAGLRPVFDGEDVHRPRANVRLVPVASGFDQITEIVFLPLEYQSTGYRGAALVLEKRGALRLWRPGQGLHPVLLQLNVETAVEQGLLGLALHPRFISNGRIYLHYSARIPGRRVDRISEWTIPSNQRKDPALFRPAEERILLEVDQPYSNHKAGHMEFGPDGLLYIGFGDGGSGGDPQHNGQNRYTLLGKLLRIDVDRRSEGRPYGLPRDNPFRVSPGAREISGRPEIWAYGLRNPWKFSFAPDRRLILADVGQNRFEELDMVDRGSNMGWNEKEGSSCFRSGCNQAGLSDPFYEYGREDGACVIGGYVYTGQDLPFLSGQYIFGDYISGRIWAASLPEKNRGTTVTALGRFPVQISTFGIDRIGEIYVADFPTGTLFRLATPAP